MSARSNIDDFLLMDLRVLPTSIGAVVTALDGIILPRNNLFDTALDVAALVMDIELVSIAVEGVTDVSADLEGLSDFLQANDAAAYTNYLASESRLQSDIDDILAASVTSQPFSVVGLAQAWEITSGITTTAAKVIATQGGEAKAVFDKAGSFATLLADDYKIPLQGLNVSFSEIDETAQVFASTFDAVRSLGEILVDDLADQTLFSEAFANQFRTTLLTLATGLEKMLTVWQNKQGTPGISELVTVVQSALKAIEIYSNWTALSDARDADVLTDHSIALLDDAIFVNALEMADVFADVIQAGASYIKINPQISGYATGFAEVGRTISDVVSIYAKSEWVEEAVKFDVLDDLPGLLTQYQNIVTTALANADDEVGGTWGRNIASVTPGPAAQPAITNILAARYDEDDEAGTFESGGVLTLGQTYAGSVPFVSFDRGDWFEIDLVAGQSYRITGTTTGVDSGDLMLLSAAGTLLAEDGHALSSTTAKIMEGTVLESGNYYVLYEADQDYTIKVETLGVTEDFVEMIEAAAGIDTAYTLSAGETFGGMIQSADVMGRTWEDDWIRIDLVAGQDYRLVLEKGTLWGGDIKFYNSLGGLLATENAALSDTDTHVIEGTAMQTGAFYAAVESRYTGSYVLSLDTVALTEDLSEMADAVASTGTVYGLETGETFRGTITYDDGDTSSSGDWVRIDLVAGQDYRFAFEEGTISHGVINLYDSIGDLYATENASLSDGNTHVIEGTAMRTGVFYAAVGSSFAGTYTSGSYVLSFDTVTLADDLSEMTDAAASTATAYTLSSGETFRGNITFSDINATSGGDWVRIDLVAGQDYRLVFEEGTILHGGIRLYDASGDLHAIEDSTLSDHNTHVIEGTATQTGAFYAAVGKPFSGTSSTGSYVLSFDVTNVNTAPEVSIDTQTLAPNAWVRLSSMIEVSDGEGDDIVAYELWDNRGRDNWYVGGTRVDAGSGHVTNTLDGVWLQADAGTSTQPLWVRAYDGEDWGAWDSFILKTEEANVAPVVTIADQVMDLNAGAWSRLSSIMEVTDANDDAITRYQVWDSAGGDNWFADGGIVDASRGYETDDPAGIWLKRDDEASTQKLFVRAHDGEEWGQWDSFILTTEI